MSAPTSVVLTRAADLIEERGWRAGEGWNSTYAADARLCLEGGIMAAIGLQVGEVTKDSLEPLWACPAYAAVSAHLATDGRLWKWNDARDRTAAEVIEVLRAAALIEAAREDQEAAWATYAELVSA